MSVKELRALIMAAGLTTTGCVDKSDLIERAAEARALPSPGGDGMAANVEAQVAALASADVLPSLEAALKRPPSQEVALLANACLDRLTHTLMEDGAALPRGRLLTVILGSMKMGLGGQGGLFTMACLPLPFGLHHPDEEGDNGESTPDLQEVIEQAEEANETTFFETLLAGLAKFDSLHAETAGSILMTMRVWLSCLIEGDGEGEDDFVALCDDDPTQLFEMLNAGLLPAVMRPMLRYPHASNVVGSGLAIVTAVCGYHPPEEVEAIVLAAGAMAPVVDALTNHSRDLEMVGSAIPLLKALTQRSAGAKAARGAGAEKALRGLVAIYPNEAELHSEVNALLGLIAQPAAAKGGRSNALSKDLKGANKAAGGAARSKGGAVDQAATVHERIDAVYLY